jgi:hypothetical protein
MDVAADMRERFLPALLEHKDILTRRLPQIRAEAGAWGVGRATGYDAFDVGIDCLLPEASADPDQIALVISVAHIHTEPVVVCADVTWGNGLIEFALESLAGQPYTEAIADQIARGLPSLADALETALRNGHPPAA